MKIGLAFLLKNELHHWNYFDAWLADAEHDYRVVCHCHALPPNSSVETCLVERQYTTWAKTINAHVALFKRCYEMNCDRVVLLSESCIPFCHISKLESDMKVPMSRFNFHDKEPEKVLGNFFKQRNIAPEFRKWVRFGEQWHILTKDHIEILLADAEVPAGRSMFRAHDKSYIDNETWALSTLVMHNRQHEIINCVPTFTQWFHYDRARFDGMQIKGNEHPVTYTKMTEELKNHIAKKNSYFARKFVPDFQLLCGLDYVV